MVEAEKVSFGKSLRQQRELRSISLEEIAEATMIKLSFLQALENEALQDLPHPTFVKGFLRAYAKHIGLDPEEVVLSYEHLLLSQKKEEGEEEEELILPQKNQIKIKPVRNLSLPILVTGGIFLAVILANLYLWPQPPPQLPPKQLKKPAVPIRTVPPREGIPEQEKEEPEEPASLTPLPPVEQLEEQTDPVIAVSEGQDEEILTAEEETAVPVAETSPEAAETIPIFSLGIHAEEDTWLLVEIDGQEDLLDFILRAGEDKILQAREKIVFQSIGNAGGLLLSFQEQTLALSSQSGQVLHNIVIEPETDLQELIDSLHKE